MMTTKKPAAEEPRWPAETFEARPNKLWPESVRRTILFLRYRQPVTCQLCGRKRLRHWTVTTPFKAADLKKSFVILKLDERIFDPLMPVCRDHPWQPAETKGK